MIFFNIISFTIINNTYVLKLRYICNLCRCCKFGNSKYHNNFILPLICYWTFWCDLVWSRDYFLLLFYRDFCKYNSGRKIHDLIQIKKIIGCFWNAYPGVFLFNFYLLPTFIIEDSVHFLCDYCKIFLRIGNNIYFIYIYRGKDSSKHRFILTLLYYIRTS